MNKKLLNYTFVFFILLFLAGCENTIPKGSFSLDPEALSLRQLQIKMYDAPDTKILAASVSVMQDLGFNIVETERTLGLIVGQKDRDATEVGQVALAVAAALFGVNSSYDRDQTIKLSVVASPVSATKNDRSQVRIAIQRVVRSSNNTFRVETMKEEAIFKEFFDKLDKAIFLEGAV